MKQDETSYSCKVHCPKGSKPTTKSSLSKKDLASLKSEGAPIGISGTTKKELVDKLYIHYSANVWKRCVKSAKQCSVVDLAGPIAQCLEARRDVWKDANLIAFEQQPDKRMLCVQAMLHMWFVCQGFRCKGVSAVHKLTNIITLQSLLFVNYVQNEIPTSFSSFSCSRTLQKILFESGLHALACA